VLLSSHELTIFSKISVVEISDYITHEGQHESSQVQIAIAIDSEYKGLIGKIVAN